jgi:hypothetical protein
MTGATTTLTRTDYLDTHRLKVGRQVLRAYLPLDQRLNCAALDQHLASGCQTDAIRRFAIHDFLHKTQKIYPYNIGIKTVLCIIIAFA